MNGRCLAFGGVVLAALALPACKPPPTDAAVARAAILPAAEGPSAPLASPDTTEAVWAQSGQGQDRPMRLVYGVPGQPVLVALECLDAASPDARLRITRHAPADNGAGALLALIGNGAIGRIPVDATEAGGRVLWEGESAAIDPVWEPLAGPREMTVTVPGAGLVRINPGQQPWELLTECRGTLPDIVPPVFMPEPLPPPILSPVP
jgi:hypothetical protein